MVMTSKGCQYMFFSLFIPYVSCIMDYEAILHLRLNRRILQEKYQATFNPQKIYFFWGGGLNVNFLV